MRSCPTSFFESHRLRRLIRGGFATEIAAAVRDWFRSRNQSGLPQASRPARTITTAAAEASRAAIKERIKLTVMTAGCRNAGSQLRPATANRTLAGIRLSDKTVVLR